MSVQRRRRTFGSSAKKSDRNLSACDSVASFGGIFPKLRQISVLSRARRVRTRTRVISAKSSELTTGSLRKPGNIRLIKSVQEFSIDRREGRVAAESR